MDIIKVLLPTLFLFGCSTNMAQYSNNYRNNSVYGTWNEINSKVTNELILNKDSKFSFTAIPFEVYKDYWGTYTIDKTKHLINFTIKGGNNIPKDAKLKNSKYSFDKMGNLILTNYYYGTVYKSKPKSIYIFKHIPSNNYSIKWQ